MFKNKKNETDSPCACSQVARDILKAVSPIKDGMLKEVKCSDAAKLFASQYGKAIVQIRISALTAAP